MMFALCMIAPSLQNAVLEIDKITAVKTFCVENTVVVAVVTKPIYLKSDRLELEKMIKEKVQKMIGKDKKVLVSFDIVLFSNIEDEMNAQKKQELLVEAQKCQ